MGDSHELFLSNADKTPMYEQIVEQITAKILAGDWRPGQAIPSIRQLAAGSRVSIITVKRAYLELERAGIIVTRLGKGSFVADSLDLPRQLALADFQSGVQTMLDAADRLRMTDTDIVHAVKAELRSRDGAVVAKPGDRR